MSTQQTNFFILVESNPDNFVLPEVLKTFTYIHLVLPSGSTTTFIYSQLKAQMLKQLTQEEFDQKVLYWLFPYFGTDADDLLVACNAVSQQSNVSDCLANIKQWSKQTILEWDKLCIPARKIQGYVVDDEVGDNNKFMLALQKLQGTSFEFTFNNIKHTTLPIQLAWSLNLTADLTPRWKGKGGNNKNVCGNDDAQEDCLDPAKWAFSLGQAYTDNTEKLYQGNCQSAFNFWHNLAYYNGTSDPNDQHIHFDDFANGGKQTPLLCGAGNCQELTVDKSKCIDERLPPDLLKNLIINRTKKLFPNCGVWYGTTPANGMTGHPNKKPNDKLCCMPEGTFGTDSKCDKNAEIKAVLPADCADCKVKYLNIYAFILLGLSIAPLIATIKFIIDNKQAGLSPFKQKNFIISISVFGIFILAAVVLFIAYYLQKCSARKANTTFYVYSNKKGPECDLATHEDGCSVDGEKCFSSMKKCCDTHGITCATTKEECDKLKGQKNKDGTTYGGVFYDKVADKTKNKPAECGCAPITDDESKLPLTEWKCDDKGENCKCDSSENKQNSSGCHFVAGPNPLNPTSTVCNPDTKCFPTIDDCNKCYSQLYKDTKCPISKVNFTS